jgi:hypothetical protein
MSSWSLLIASQGQVLDGPAGVIGFKPCWQPEDHRSFFTAPEAWGLFTQKRQDSTQHERLEIRHGQLQVRELVFECPPAPANLGATVRLAGRESPSSIRRDGPEVRLTLPSLTKVNEGQAIEVELRA